MGFFPPEDFARITPDRPYIHTQGDTQDGTQCPIWQRDYTGLKYYEPLSWTGCLGRDMSVELQSS
jgi:hypothetical protein